MTWYLQCLLCGLNDRTVNSSYGLDKMRNHAVEEHGCTLAEVQSGPKSETDTGYTLNLPGGTPWLKISRGGNYVGGI